MSKKKRTNPQASQTNTQPGMLSNLSETASSALDSARDAASGNKWIIAGIGIGAAVAGYLFATEHGRKMQGRIGDAVKDSLDSVREQAVAGWDKVRTTVQDQIENLS